MGVRFQAGRMTKTGTQRANAIQAGAARATMANGASDGSVAVIVRAAAKTQAKTMRILAITLCSKVRLRKARVSDVQRLHEVRRTGKRGIDTPEKYFSTADPRFRDAYFFFANSARRCSSWARSSGVNSAPKSSASNTWRISISDSSFSNGFGQRLIHSIASAFDLTWRIQ